MRGTAALLSSCPKKKGDRKRKSKKINKEKKWLERKSINMSHLRRE